MSDPVKKRYHQANEDCIALGGILSSPTSADDNDQLSVYVRQSIGQNEQIWLGVNDMVKEGDWKDQTGLSILFKNWDNTDYRSPQPNGAHSENCAVLEAKGGKWSDENCSEEKASVCEFNSLRRTDDIAVLSWALYGSLSCFLYLSALSAIIVPDKG